MNTTTKEEKLGAPTVPAPLAVRPEVLPAAPSVDWLKRALTPGQITTLCATVAPADTPDDVLAAFFWSARRRGLDPFLRQVHLVKRRRRAQKDDSTWGYEDHYVHQTGIDGFRLISGRVTIESGKLQGERALDGIKRGCSYDDQGRLTGAWAEVYRKDCTHPFRAEVDFDEYCPLDTKGMPTGLWARMPKGQIMKCAEAAAHRMANPEDLGDTYEHAELDAAEHIAALNREETPPVSSATAPSPEGIVEAELVRPAEEGSTERVSAGSAFAEENPGPPPDERLTLAANILAVAGHFSPKLADHQWARITGHFTGAARPMEIAALAVVEQGTLQDILTFLRGMASANLGVQAATQKQWKNEVSKWTPR